MSKFVAIIFGLVALIIAGVLIFAPRRPAVNLDEFAKCLAQKGAVMYGAYWCSVCKKEKEAFGDSFRFVSYVECSTETRKCLDAGINGYPTWTFPDGRKFEGLQGVEKLSQESGCPLPQLQQ